MRSQYCGHIRKEHVGESIQLCGWVNRRRDLGGLIFIDLRDREGLVQVVFDPDQTALFEKANALCNEFCIQLTGAVRARPENQVNSNMATGEVEIMASDIEILNKSQPLPLDANQNNSEEQRFKYRYLDLRCPEMTNRMIFRSKVTQSVRRFLDDNGLDIENLSNRGDTCWCAI